MLPNTPSALSAPQQTCLNPARNLGPYAIEQSFWTCGRKEVFCLFYDRTRRDGKQEEKTAKSRVRDSRPLKGVRNLNKCQFLLLF